MSVDMSLSKTIFLSLSWTISDSYIGRHVLAYDFSCVAWTVTDTQICPHIALVDEFFKSLSWTTIDTHIVDM